MQSINFFEKLCYRFPLQYLDGAKEISFIHNPTFSEALYIASSTLHSTLLKGNVSEKEKRKIQASLYKYSNRISRRCTPYGLFAGVGIAKWGERSVIELSKEFNRKTRLDMNILCAIVQNVATDEKVISFLKYYPNTSIYKVDNQLRYVEYFLKDGRRVHKISAVEINNYLENILQNSKKGEYIETLINKACDDKITSNEVRNYIHQLIHAQILVSEIEPSVTGGDYTLRLIEQLSNINLKAESDRITYLLNGLEKINDIFKALDNKLGNGITEYEEVNNILKKLNIIYDEKNLFQVDLSNNHSPAVISVDIQAKLLRTLDSLSRLNRFKQPSKFENFIDRFRKRYELATVPLLEVLDTDIGLGYPQPDLNGYNPLVDDMIFAGSRKNTKITWDEQEEFLFNKLLKAHLDNKFEVEITSDELRGFNEKPLENYTDTMGIMFNVLDSLTNKIHFQYATGASATTLIGRFAHLNDEFSEILNEISEFENAKNPEQILAEIVHLPESRTGNILFRPSFRKYEIPYLATSNVDPLNQIKVQDIVVTVREDRIILFHKDTNKEIIPRMANAHAFSNTSLPIYNFLCDLQYQGRRSIIQFTWGALANQFNFLPRVKIDDVIVFPATWIVKEEQWRSLVSENMPIETNSIKLFLSKNNIPSTFLLVERDNHLYFDLLDNDGLKTFLSMLRGRKQITIIECLEQQNNSLIKDQHGRAHSNECIALFKSNQTPKIPNNFTYKPVLKSKREFIPGSKWLYFKIYSGIKSSDNIIKKLHQKILKLKSNKKIVKWFFIRYSDPDHHLRVRLSLAKKRDLQYVIQEIYKVTEPLLSTSIIHKIMLDKYDRELERYGDSNINNSESLFYIDSELCVQFLKKLGNQDGQETRWKWAIASVDNLLIDFGFNLESKHELLSILRTNYFIEFRANRKSVKLQLDHKFRTLRKELKEIIEDPKLHFTNEQLLLLKNRSKSMKGLVLKIKRVNKSENIDIKKLLMSYVHMNLNRLFMGNSRLNELIVYDLMYRYYDSKLIQINKIKPLI